MAKDIKVEEAKSWDDEEAAYNISYLDTRCEYEKVAEIKRLRGDKDAVAEVVTNGVETVGGISPDTGPGDSALSSDMTAQEVSDWVGDDVVRAGQALQLEMERDEPRKGLTSHLEKLTEVES